MNVFEAVKQSVTTRRAAEHYGTRVGRNGMCVCPFHNDKNPSMKVDRRFHCFGCQADGDVIDFVSRLHGIGSKEAALLLADRLTARQLLGLCAASQRFAEQCDQNAGVGQILGALAVKWEELL